MPERPIYERRNEPGQGLAPSFLATSRLSRPVAWTLVLVAVCLTGFADWITGADVWFGPIYLCIVGLVAWFLGRLQAIGVGLACVALVLYSHGLDLYPYGTVAAQWNLAMRVLAVLMVVGLLDLARRSYEREWLLARTDPLTGALNRFAFFEVAGAIHQSHGWNLLAYADLDGLKKLNDRQGHAIGDRCIVAYAQHVKKKIRSDDIFARIGGDEFLVYMAVRDENAARDIATRLHLAMNAIASQMASGLRCSIGVLILPPGSRSVDRELKAADKLMYEAKKRGAALVVATGHERAGSLHLARHTEFSHSFVSEASGPGPTSPVPTSPDDADRQRSTIRIAG